MEKNRIKFLTKPKFRNPVMIAGWPGMGAVATQAVDYLRSKLKNKLFAEIETKDLMVPMSISVSDGIGYFSEMPKILLFYSEEHNLIICEGDEQFSGSVAVKVIDTLLRVAKSIKVSRIYTGAALVQHMSHKEGAKAFCVSNTSSLKDWISKEKGIPFLKHGQVSGLNGSLLGFAAEKDIEAACFLATMPIYAVNLPNPKAARAIVEAWQKVIGFSVDLSDFDGPIQEADRALAIIEDQIKKFTANSEEKEEKVHAIQKTSRVPQNVKRKIEKLFETAKKDKRIAHALKEELDRWGVFKEYEDRFLDLFRDGQ
jgi:uncharacterized protein